MQLDNVRASAQSIYDIATARLRNHPLDANVAHDLAEIAKLAMRILGEANTSAGVFDPESSLGRL